MHRAALLLAIFAPLACETEGASEKVAAIGKQASDAADTTKKLADDATAASKDAADKGKAMYHSAAQAWADIPDTGQLSGTAKGWLATATDEETIEVVVREGKQIAPVALEIGKSFSDAIDSDTAIEPIYQRVAEGEVETVDAAIADMPRTEVVDGLTLGFKQFDETSNSKSVKERGYLVTWRDGDHLYGFVYRSKRTIDLDKLVSDAPRLLKLAQAAVGG